MNIPRRFILTTAFILFLITGLYPHHIERLTPIQAVGLHWYKYYGRALLMSPPSTSKSIPTSIDFLIDYKKLFLEWALIAGTATFFWVMVGDRKKKRGFEQPESKNNRVNVTELPSETKKKNSVTLF